MDYSKKDILENLNTKIVGKTLMFFDEIDSTNDYLKENIDILNEGSVVVSKSQIKGRGRRGNSWENAKDESIFLSILLKPSKMVNSSLRISLVSALAVYKALSFTNLPINIKWPNDIIINNKKVGGILTEVVSYKREDDFFDALIIGIGINVNNMNFSPTILKTATSLKLESSEKNDFDIAKIIALICKNVENSYYTYLSDGFKFFLEDYKNICANMNKDVKLIFSDREEVGKIIDINKDGSILFKRNDGLVKSVFACDVSVRTKDGYL